MVEGYTDCIACWEAGIKKRRRHAGHRAHGASRQDAHPLLPSASCICLTETPRVRRPPAARFSLSSRIQWTCVAWCCPTATILWSLLRHMVDSGAADAHRRCRAAYGLCLPFAAGVERHHHAGRSRQGAGGRSHAHLSAARQLYDRHVLYPDCRSVGWIWRPCARARAACFATSPSAGCERRREQNYERQRAQAERSGSAGGRSSGLAGDISWCLGIGATHVAAPVEEEPCDYVPPDAYGAAPVEVVDDLPPIDA